jgi:hypothetical protein
MSGRDRKPAHDDWDDPTEITQPSFMPPQAAHLHVDMTIEDEDEDESEELLELGVDDLEELPELGVEHLTPIDHELPGGPAFVVLEPEEPPRVFWVHEDLTLGRSADVNIPIASPTASRSHATILLTSEGCVLEDLLSENGTFVNGEGIERAVLRPGDTIRIAHVELRYLGAREDEQRWDGRPAVELCRYTWQLPPGSDAETRMFPGKLMDRRARVRRLLRRAELRSRDSEARWHLGHDPHVLGGDGDIPVAGSVLEKAAEILWTGVAHQLRRLGRRDNVHVNGEPVEECLLMPGDRIQVAREHFAYELA